MLRGIMKIFLSAIALMVSGAVVAASASVKRPTLTFAALTPTVNFFLGVKGVFSTKDIRVDTKSVTTYTAGFAYAPDGVQTLAQRMDQAIGGAGVTVASVAQNGLGNAGVVTPAVAWKYLYDGEKPTQWHVAGANVLATDNIMLRALFSIADANALPNNKAYVEASERQAEAKASTSMDTTLWGVRVEAGLGFSVTQACSVYAFAGYTFTASEGDKSSKKVLSIETPGRMETFDSALGDAVLSANLIQESFRYNQFKVVSDMGITASVQETFLTGAMLDWAPISCLSFFAVAGVKRYKVEVKYSEGCLAFPGTEAIDRGDTFEKCSRPPESKPLLQTCAWLCK